MVFKQVESSDFSKYAGIIKHFYPHVLEAFQQGQGILFTTERYPQNDVLYFLEEEVFLIVEQLKNKKMASQYLLCYPEQYLGREVKLYTNNALLFEVIQLMRMPREHGYFLFTYAEQNKAIVASVDKQKNKTLYIIIAVIFLATIGRCGLQVVIQNPFRYWSDDVVHDEEWNDYFFNDEENNDYYDDYDNNYEDYYNDPSNDPDSGSEEVPVGA